MRYACREIVATGLVCNDRQRRLFDADVSMDIGIDAALDTLPAGSVHVRKAAMNSTAKGFCQEPRCAWLT